jgi:hypothetical protein
MTKLQHIWRDGLALYIRFMNYLGAGAGQWFLPLAARFTFVAVRAGYYWASAMTKLSEGILALHWALIIKFCPA